MVPNDIKSTYQHEEKETAFLLEVSNDHFVVTIKLALKTQQIVPYWSRWIGIKFMDFIRSGQSIEVIWIAE